MSGFYDTSSNFHPFECDHGGACIHCSRRKTETHDPATCALCDPDYDGAPNPAHVDGSSVDCATSPKEKLSGGGGHG